MGAMREQDRHAQSRCENGETVTVPKQRNGAEQLATPSIDDTCLNLLAASVAVAVACV